MLANFTQFALSHFSLQKIECWATTTGLTSLCWDKSQVSWDWMMSQTWLPVTAGSSLQAFGHCRQKNTSTTTTEGCLPGLQEVGVCVLTRKRSDLWNNESNLRVCLSVGVSVLEWRRGKRPDRRFTGLFRGDLADNPGGWGSQSTVLGFSIS